MMSMLDDYNSDAQRYDVGPHDTMGLDPDGNYVTYDDYESNEKELLARIEELETKLTDKYRKGFLDGIEAYAWHKDLCMYVGTTGRKLIEAQFEVEDTWNYNPSD